MSLSRVSASGLRQSHMRRLCLLLLCLGLALAGCTRATPLPAVAPEEVGLIWRECPASDDWQQVEACFGERPPQPTEAEALRYGERLARGQRLRVGSETIVARAYPIRLLLPILPDLYVLTRNGRPVVALWGHMETYEPSISLQVIAGQVTWEFADPYQATVIHGGRDLRSVYGLQAAYSPYELAGKLIFVGRRANRYLLIYDGRQVGPAFDHVTIAYCCEIMLYAPRGGEGRYRFWGERDASGYVVEVSAR
ncbi:MAG: hypothetical protein ACUVX9_17415 [Anaerolineae bacterium]